MEDQKKYKVGDKIVEFGQVFRIFKIENKKNKEGGNDRILHFRPYFKSDENKGMICSIPEDSLEQTNIREPISRTAARDLIKKLSQRPQNEVATDVDSVKQALGLNDPHQTVRVVRGLWIEKITAEVFTKSKKDMFALSTSRLVEEFAFVIKTTPEKSGDKILAALEKGHK